MGQRVETVIVGAGQAGLATGYHLQRLGRPFLIVDGNRRVGDNWRQQWDSLVLYSPAKYDGLPGMRFPARPWSYPGKEQVADFLESYAAHWRLPIKLNTRVRSLQAAPSGFVVATDDGLIECDNVVVATGTFSRTPNIPNLATQLDRAILQLHSSEYRRPSQLNDGPVLVVGASHSGTDIAYEVAQTHPTKLCGRDCGSIPFRPGSTPARLAFPLVVQRTHVSAVDLVAGSRRGLRAATEALGRLATADLGAPPRTQSRHGISNLRPIRRQRGRLSPCFVMLIVVPACCTSRWPGRCWQPKQTSRPAAAGTSSSIKAPTRR